MSRYYCCYHIWSEKILITAAVIAETLLGKVWRVSSMLNSKYHPFEWRSGNAVEKGSKKILRTRGQSNILWNLNFQAWHGHWTYEFIAVVISCTWLNPSAFHHGAGGGRAHNFLPLPDDLLAVNCCKERSICRKLINDSWGKMTLL